MSPDVGYRLLAVDTETRLEQFGPRTVDRPSPGATTTVAALDPRADLHYRRSSGWSGSTDPWHLEWRDLRLELRPTPTGQVGLFPEHATMWSWLSERLLERPGASVVNLFAYTGASSLHLARQGARVTHVDASRPAVSWARRNAALSGLAGAPVRWLVDDAEAFVEREVRRHRTYDGIVLDPPTYGHGSGGRTWQLDDGLDPLLIRCARLTTARPGFLLLTAHTPGWDGARLEAALARRFGPGRSESGPLELRAEDGSVLPLGAWAWLIMAP